MSNALSKDWTQASPRASSRPRRDYESDKGVYEPVGSRSVHRQDKRTSGILYMIFLLVCGLGLMLAHHFFYAYLNDKSIDPGSTELPPRLKNQDDVDFIGKTFAHGARIALSMAIGGTFAQLFWATLRSRSHSIGQFDALVNCGQTPFHSSAFQAVTASAALFIVSLVASATALLVVLTPGSLTISANFSTGKPCTVPTVPQDVMKSDYDFADKNGTVGFPVEAVLSTMLSSNTYLPPFQSNQELCGDVTSCLYNVSFVGPALDCVDVTNRMNLSSLINSSMTISNSTPFLVWNASGFTDSIGLSILSRDLVNGVSQATNCSAYNATYDTVVGFADGSSTIAVRKVTLDLPISPSDSKSFINFHIENGIGMLIGLIWAGPNGAISRTEFGNIPSPFFVTTSDGNHTFGDSVSHFASSFMQNLSLSLLSGSFNYGLSNNTASNFEDASSTCIFPVTFYIYDSTRLLATYGVMLGFATALVAYGCTLLWRNGLEEKLVFSDVVHTTLNEEMFSRSESVQSSTKVHVIPDGRGPGTFQPASSMEMDEDDTKLSEFVQRKHCLAIRWKLALFVLAASTCMILNHAYYHYLEGKAPSSDLAGASDFFLNQVIVSDTGNALAYIGQTFLAAAVATACTQLFWRAVRSRGHSISQIDALMNVQFNPISPSLLRALKVSFLIPLLALFVFSTSLISIFAPGSITVPPDQSQSRDCAALSLRNLSALETKLSDYTTPIFTGMSLATNFEPIDACESASDVGCAYDLQFIGPGFSCEDVTASSNKSAFTNRFGKGIIPLYLAQVLPQTSNLTMQTSVQTMYYDGTGYQAVNCTGVLRSYSASIGHGVLSPSSINVTGSQVISTINANTSQLSTFAEAYVFSMMRSLQQAPVLSAGGSVGMGNSALGADNNVVVMPFSVRGGIGKVQLDGNITWDNNMSLALESFAQNATLSLLSGQISAFNPEDPNVLENITTTCTYTFPAYRYVPYRLFLTYGVAIFITMICAILGCFAIWRNGTDETLEFSRILRAVLNEKMFNGRRYLDEDTIVKADETVEGNLIPSISESSGFS
ncbi:hypothetical protein SCHPADRAFT_890622 [Schizopora paradoxa]|uniref:Uncharacterized protein n=1 Tax=Schizopora paradoxa TaxID=27342 RepID=A0A0H2RM23_9AGAM|nr:hypothetical protein SCHPADRAFT_890622 [Schizopora paradoxa]